MALYLVQSLTMVPLYLSSVPTRETEISQSLLNIDNKERSNLFAWNGQFSPQLIEVLLKTYAKSDATVLDPFAGSGTVLYECGLERLGAVAAEINPSAFAMARLYELINLPLDERRDCLDTVQRLIEPVFPRFTLSGCREGTHDEPELRANLCRIARKASGWSRYLTEALAIMSDGKNGREAIPLTWRKIRRTIEALPCSQKPLVIFNCDARQLPIRPESVDLVITSPPYINVFNYHQQYRAGAEALGWDVLSVAKSEIGSNRKHRGNRFLTVIQYCLDLTTVLTELNRVCKPSGHAIFVVGRESSVRGVRFFNGEIVARLAAECTGFHLGYRQERVFKNRFGQSIVEDILHFKCGKSRKHCDLFNLTDARQVAKSLMQNALKEPNPKGVTADIESAIAEIENVEPSPLFDSHGSRKEAQ